MKEGWTYKKLGDIAVSMADGPFGSNLKAEHYTQNREVRIIQLSNIGEEGWRDENKKYTTYNHLETIKRSEVCPGDIVIAKMMPAGRAVICPNIDSKYVLSSDAVRVTLKEKIDHKFIYYAINSPYFRKQVYENVSGSGRVRTSLTKLRDCVIGTPTFSEQKRIVSRLDAAFSHIDELKSNAEKQLSEARALFQKSLAKAMEPKESWSIDKLVEVFNFIDYRGSTPTKLNEGVPLITAKNVKFGYLDYSIKDFISREEFETRKSRGISQKGDLLFTTEAPLGNVAIADLDEFSAGQRLITLQKYKHSKYEFLNEFYYFYMLSSHFQERIKELATGATAQGIKAKILKTVIVPIPPLTEQQRIVERLDALSAHVRELEENQKKIISECDALKQALLRKVFE
jgi:type I restriction enzyme S subunit